MSTNAHATLALHAVLAATLLLAGSCAFASDEHLMDLAPGGLHDVGTHRMHLRCTGDGTPTVVMDAGLGGNALDWSRVQPRVASYTRACSYDRSGLGFSESSPGKRTSETMAAELRALLRAAEVPPPYVLVGHSFGGFNVRVFASRFPQDVAGLVLVDASHESQFERFESEFGLNLAPKRRGHMRVSPPRAPAGLDADANALYARLAQRVPTLLAIREELFGFRASAAEVARAVPIRQMPLVVVTRGEQQWRRTRKGPALEALWRELQQSLAELVVGADHIVAHRSGHYVHVDQPELVDQAIHNVVRRSLGERARWQQLAMLGAERL